jgi:hypothetical protein
MTVLNISLPDDRYRRRMGFALGGLLGLCYGLVLHLGDRITVPGVPLFRPPFGSAVNVVLFTLAGAVLGILVAWPLSGITGTFLVAAGSAVVIIVVSLLSAGLISGNLLVSTITGVFLALPFWGMLVPLFGALRWVIGNQEEAHRDHQSWRGRVWGPLVLLVVVGLVGLVALYPPRGRDILVRAHNLLQAAQQGASVPPASGETVDFAPHANSSYELAWENRGLEKYRIPRPGRNFDMHSAVVTRFADSWNLVCVYIVADELPLCRGFDELPR